VSTSDGGQIEDMEHGFTHGTDWMTFQTAASEELGEAVYPYQQIQTL